MDYVVGPPKFQLSYMVEMDKPEVLVVDPGTTDFRALSDQLGATHPLINSASNPPECRAIGVLVAKVPKPEDYIEVLGKMGVAAYPVHIADDKDKTSSAETTANLAPNAFALSHADANVLREQQPHLNDKYKRSSSMRII